MVVAEFVEVDHALCHVHVVEQRRGYCLIPLCHILLSLALLGFLRCLFAEFRVGFWPGMILDYFESRDSIIARAVNTALSLRLLLRQLCLELLDGSA